MLPCINTVNSGKSHEDNPEPSLHRDVFEGATTRIYLLEQKMKSVEICQSRSAVTFNPKGVDVKDSLICIAIYIKGVVNGLL